MSARHLSRGIVAAGLILGSSVFAQSASYDVALDTDLDAGTGCTFTPVAGAAIDGIESRLRATVDTSTQTVTDLVVLRCTGGSSFVADTTLPAGYPAALNQGTGGADVIELAAGQSDLLGGSRGRVQLYFTAEDGAGSDVIETLNGQAGGPILISPPFAIPSLTVMGLLALALLVITAAWFANRRTGHFMAVSAVMLVALAAWASQHAADGNLGEWAGSGPIAQDPGGDATNGSAALDLVAAFAALENDGLYFRVDVVDLENQPPQAVDDSFSTDEDTPLNVAAPGVLGNDSDPETDPITAVLDAPPASAASFTLNADGSFDYTPDPDFNGSDSFTYFANDGQADSASATVSITVNATNDPPVAQDDSAVTDEDQPIDIDVLANDSDVDGNLDPASVNVTVAPANGTTTVNTATGVITYTKSADFSGADSFDYEVCDDGTPTPVACDTATVSLTIDAVNDPPSFTAAGAVSVDEDSGAYSATWATDISAGPPDESGQTLSFNVTANDNPALFSAGPAIDSSGNLTFTPGADLSGSASITVVLTDDGGTANGGSDTSAPASFSITVNPVNDAPTFTTGGDVAVDEDSGAYSAAWATAIDAGAPDESGQTLSFGITGNDNAGLFASGPTIDAAGNLSFTPAADAFGTANITVELSDDGGTANGGADTSAPVGFAITINGINDAPSFVSGGNVAVDEDSGAYSAAWATAVSAGPANESGQVLAFNVTANDNPALFSAQPAVDAGGSLAFTPATDANGSATITLELLDDGGTANGGVDTSAPVTFTITVNPVNDPPVVTAPGPFDATGNVGIQVTDGADDLLTGVTDPADGASAQPFSITATTAASAMGGDVSINADGSFSYDPPVGYTGADTFDYEVCDSGTPGSACTTATVTIDVSDMLWFVDPAEPAGGDGRLSTPFNDIDALAAINDGTGNNPAAGDALFLYNGTHDGSIALLDGQRVFGQSATAPLTTLVGISLPAYSAALPATNTGTTTLQATNATTINLAQNNTLGGFDIGNTGTGTGILGNGIGTLSITEMAIAGTGQALSLTNGSVSATLDSITSTGSSGDGLLLSGVGGSFTVNGSTAIDGAAGIGVNVQNVSASYTFGDVTVNNRNSAGVFVNAFTGGAQNGQFGTVTINNQAASNTTALGIDNTTGGSITVASALIDNGGANVSGIALSGNAAAIDILAGNVVNAAGAAVSISSGSGNITYAGSIGNASGRSLQVLDNTGGTITLAGDITDSGAGIRIDNNAATGIDLAGNLSLNTATDTAFSATNGGTLTLTGAASTVTTTSGRGVRIDGVTIGAAGATFERVSVNGASNGIYLADTGTTGTFSVTGSGGACTMATPACSGGRVQATAGATGAPEGNGVYLSNTGRVELSLMRIDDHPNHAVYGSNVAGFSLVDSLVDGANGDDAGADEGSLSFSNLTGSADITRTSVSGGLEDNLRLVNDAGLLDRLVIVDSRFSDNSAALGNDGILIEARGTAVVDVTVSSTDFAAHRGDHFDAAATDSAVLDLIFTANTLTGGHPSPLGQSFILSNSQSALVTFDVTNNQIDDAVVSAFTFFQSNTSTISSALAGTFSGNQVGLAGAPGSGSAQGNGVVFNATGNGAMTFSADGNTIRQWSNPFGLLVQAGDGSPVVNGTVSNNLLEEPNTASFPANGLHLNVGTTAAGAVSACVDIFGNTLAGAGASGADDFRLRQRNSSTVNLPGYGGAAGDTGAVVSYVQGNNTGTPTGSAAVSGSGGGFTGTGGSCPTP